MTISERANLISKKLNLTQKEIGDKLGVAQGTVQKWFTNGKPFSAEYIVPLSELLRVSPHFLLTGEEAPAEKVPEIPEGYIRLDEGEFSLIEWYRDLDYEGKIKVSGTAVDELRRVQQENEINAPAAKSGRAG